MDLLSAAPWAPALAALIFGVAIGWMVWGRQDDADEASPDDASKPGDATIQIIAIEQEIRAARAALDETAEDAAELEKSMTALDEALKRANGRLKLLTAAVRKKSDSD